VSALADRGFDLGAIGRLYSDETSEALAEAIDLEQRLSALSPAA
jgi:hypothetical protein